jgi:hypothetical protein
MNGVNHGIDPLGEYADIVFGMLDVLEDGRLFDLLSLDFFSPFPWSPTIARIAGVTAMTFVSLKKGIIRMSASESTVESASRQPTMSAVLCRMP